MKNLKLIIATTLVATVCKSQQKMENESFRAQKISKTASFIVNQDIEKVFPLYGAFEERKWVYGWDPKLIYPSKEVVEEQTTFSTKGRDDEPEYLWRVTRFDPIDYLVQYLVSTSNRYWTITVQCEPHQENKTLTKVTYSFIGLNQRGNVLNEQALSGMYAQNLEDWKEAIDYYFKNDKCLIPELR